MDVLLFANGTSSSANQKSTIIAGGAIMEARSGRTYNQIRASMVKHSTIIVFVAVVHSC